jgi:BTB/POZ domain
MVTITVTSKRQQIDQPDGLSEAAQERKFLIHKDFICYYSGFFAAAFNRSLMEGQSQTMTLDDIDPKTFGLLVDWLYIQRVEAEVIDLPILARLWIMDDRFLMPGEQIPQ